MDRKRNSSHREFRSVNSGASSNDPNVCSQAATKQLPQNATVQELRDALQSATQEIKSLKEDNARLKERIVLLEDGERQEVMQLKEELKKIDELHKKVSKKLRDRTQAHVDILGLLGQKEEELKRSEEKLKSTCVALEDVCKDHEAQKKEEPAYIQKQEKSTKENEEAKNEDQAKIEMKNQQKEKIEKEGKHNDMEKTQSEEKDVNKKKRRRRRERGGREKNRSQHLSSEAVACASSST